MTKYLIKHYKDECMGCGACAAASSNHFEMKINGKSDLINSKIEDNKQILELDIDFDINYEAAECCPINCIHIFRIKDDSEEKVI